MTSVLFVATTRCGTFTKIAVNITGKTSISDIYYIVIEKVGGVCGCPYPLAIKGQPLFSADGGVVQGITLRLNSDHGLLQDIA